MAGGSHECQFPSCDSIRMEPACPSLYSAGASRLTWSGVAATPPSRVTASARRHAGPARTRGPVAAPPAAATAGLLPAAGNPHICSGKSLVSELCAVPLPSSGRTHLAVRLTVGDPRLITRRWPEHGKPRACLPGNPHVYLEM